MKNWKSFFAQKITVEEYYIATPTQYDTFQFRIRYVKHNGYTLIEPLTYMEGDITPRNVEFLEWLKLRSDLNTRYDKPHWYKRIRFNRKKKIVVWAVKSIDRAYSIWRQELLDTINNQ